MSDERRCRCCGGVVSERRAGDDAVVVWARDCGPVPPEDRGIPQNRATRAISPPVASEPRVAPEVVEPPPPPTQANVAPVRPAPPGAGVGGMLRLVAPMVAAAASAPPAPARARVDSVDTLDALEEYRDRFPNAPRPGEVWSSNGRTRRVIRVRFDPRIDTSYVVFYEGLDGSTFTNRMYQAAWETWARGGQIVGRS